MKKIIISILISALLTLNSCWDMREINELGLVMAVGIDKAEGSNEYIITAQIPNPKPTGGTEIGKSSNSESFFVITAKGKTLFDATRELTKTASKRIMWAHNTIVIIGEDLAKDDITPVIDYFTHNPELRMKTMIVISKGDAGKYLSSKSGMEDIPGSAFSNIYANGKLTAEFIQTDLLKLSQDFFGEYSQPIVSMISFKKSKILPGEGKSQELVDEVSFGGAAVFYKNKMVGTLTPEETKGIAWIFNDTGNTLVIVNEPTQPNKSVTLETINVKADITAKIQNDKPKITIKITGKARIVEEDGTTYLSINDYKKTLERLVNKEIVNDINMSLNKIQKSYKCDVLNLAKNFHAQQNKAWKKDLKKDWQTIYPELPIKINVNITIFSSTTLQIPTYEIEKD